MISRSAFNPNDYANARFLSLTYIPVSEEAHRLKERLKGTLFPQVGKRGPGKPPDIEARSRTALAIVADLLDATRSSRQRWVYRTLTASSFSRQEVSYRPFVAAIEAMERLGLLVKVGGYRDKKPAFGGEPYGRATRWQATGPLFELCAAEGIAPENVTQHFKAAIPTRPVVLRASSTRVRQSKIRGKLLEFTPSEKSRAFEAEVNEINEFLHNCEIRNATHRGFQRGFNQGDDPDFYAWDKGGRLYSIDDGNYQLQSQAERAKITINGLPVVEIDIRASFLTLYHALLEEPFDSLFNDPYLIEGIPRKVLKSWLLIAFGSCKSPAKWSPEAGKDYKNEHTTKLGKDYPIRVVEKAIVEKHPALGYLATSGIDYFDMMFIESQAVIAAMLTLIRDHGVPSLPVHDSLIVPETESELAKEVFKQAYIDNVGVEPFLKIESPREIQ